MRGALRQSLDAPRYAAEVLRRDGWRRLLTDRAPVRAAARGTLAGWRSRSARDAVGVRRGRPAGLSPSGAVPST